MKRHRRCAFFASGYEFGEKPVIASSEVRVLLGSVPQCCALLQEPLDDLERFLSLMRFDSRGKSRDLQLEFRDFSDLFNESFRDIDSSHFL